MKGRVRFLKEVGLDDTSAYVHHASPVIIFVDKIQGLPRRQQSLVPLILTPVALFEHQAAQTRPLSGQNRRFEFGYTYVQCRDGRQEDIDEAAHWIGRYAQKHGGEVVTNFDERLPFLADAPLSYQRLAAKVYDRNIIQIICQDGGKLAERIDRLNYSNYGQVGVMGNYARSDDSNFAQFPEGKFMTEYSNFGQVGAMGAGAHSDRSQFFQQNPAGSIDIAQLTTQLASVRAEMKRQALPDDVGHDSEIGSVAAAEQAAKSGDLSKALGFLRNAGTWTVAVAKSVAADLVKDAIEGKLRL